MYEKDIMSFEPILPQDFNGVFSFTNWTDEDFVGKWGGKEYHFASQSTSPMVIPEHSPLEIQQIRKKFAKDLGEREFFKSQNYGKYMNQERNADGTVRLNSMHQAGTYSLDTLSPYIQKCLEPLEVKAAKVTAAPKDAMEDKLTRNEDGELNSEAIDRKASLRDKALKG